MMIAFRAVARTAALATAMTVATMAPASAQQPPAASVDIAALGPQIGSRVPGFELRDQNGRMQTLESIAGAKGAMLVFFRSADW